MAKEKKDNWIKRILQGRVVSLVFFKKNLPVVVLSLFMIICLIANKYQCQTQIEEIMRLTKDLNNAKTERVKASSDYNSKIRETQMRQLIDTMHLDLSMPERPPYKL